MIIILKVQLEQEVITILIVGMTGNYMLIADLANWYAVNQIVEVLFGFRKV